LFAARALVGGWSRWTRDPGAKGRRGGVSPLLLRAKQGCCTNSFGQITTRRTAPGPTKEGREKSKVGHINQKNTRKESSLGWDVSGGGALSAAGVVTVFTRSGLCFRGVLRGSGSPEGRFSLRQGSPRSGAGRSGDWAAFAVPGTRWPTCFFSSRRRGFEGTPGGPLVCGIGTPRSVGVDRNTPRQATFIQAV